MGRSSDHCVVGPEVARGSARGPAAAALLLAVVVGLAAGCSPKVVVEDTRHEPKHGATDTALGGAFKPWDGTWQGRFFIYEDFGAQKAGSAPPSSADAFDALMLQLAVSKSVGLTALFKSESPFFQKVVMEESSEKDGIVVKEQYRGVRKVQDGRLLWVMDRAGSTLTDEGESLGPGKMVWRRKNAEGIAIETRYETVSGTSIRVTGWIYEASDNTSLSPRLWIRCDLKLTETATRVPKLYE